eukprot:6182825-Pleurochrysis_carterae.AAC.1
MDSNVLRAGRRPSAKVRQLTAITLDEKSKNGAWMIVDSVRRGSVSDATLCCNARRETISDMP